MLSRFEIAHGCTTCIGRNNMPAELFLNALYSISERSYQLSESQIDRFKDYADALQIIILNYFLSESQINRI